jgi:hypothetical protein
MSEPMTEARLSEIEARNNIDVCYALHSGCDDYACYCHFNMPEMIAEVRRLRAELAECWEVKRLLPVENCDSREEIAKLKNEVAIVSSRPEPGPGWSGYHVR